MVLDERKRPEDAYTKRLSSWNQLVDRWEKPIGDWAISKGWMNTAAPRSMLELLMLIETELHEIEQGAERNDPANVIEECADVVIRIIQLRAEYGIIHRAAAPYTWFNGDDGSPAVTDTWRCVCEAAEAWRKKGDLVTRKTAVWEWLSLVGCAMAGLVLDFSDKSDPANPGTMFPALEAAVEKKMAANAERPYMHGKTA